MVCCSLCLCSLCRYWTLEEALQTLRAMSLRPSHTSSVPTTVISTTLPTYSSRRNKRDNDDQAVSDRASAAGPDDKKGKGGDEGDESEDEESALWCQYCVDDPSITLCCFCGCRVSSHIHKLCIDDTLSCCGNNFCACMYVYFIILGLLWKTRFKLFAPLR
jgi:hypothetical protein